MSAEDHLQPAQFDELAARKKQKFNAVLDQVPSFDEEIEADAARLKGHFERLQDAKVQQRRASFRVVK